MHCGAEHIRPQNGGSILPDLRMGACGVTLPAIAIEQMTRA